MSLRQGSATAYGSKVLYFLNCNIPGALPLAIHGLPFQGKQRRNWRWQGMRWKRGARSQEPGVSRRTVTEARRHRDTEKMEDQKSEVQAPRRCAPRDDIQMDGKGRVRGKPRIPDFGFRTGNDGLYATAPLRSRLGSEQAHGTKGVPWLLRRRLGSSEEQALRRYAPQDDSVRGWGGFCRWRWLARRRGLAGGRRGRRGSGRRSGCRRGGHRG